MRTWKSKIRTLSNGAWGHFQNLEKRINKSKVELVHLPIKPIQEEEVSLPKVFNETLDETPKEKYLEPKSLINTAIQFIGLQTEIINREEEEVGHQFRGGRSPKWGGTLWANQLRL